MITLDTPYNGHFTNLNYRVYSLWLAREIHSNHFLFGKPPGIDFSPCCIPEETRGFAFCGFCQVVGCWTDSTCSYRLRGLPSSSGSPSLLHLRALAPQRHVASFRQGTVEPQPPPHAHSVVAWPIARQGFYGSQPTSYPVSDQSCGRSHSPHPNVTDSYDDRPTYT